MGFIAFRSIFQQRDPRVDCKDCFIFYLENMKLVRTIKRNKLLKLNQNIISIPISFGITKFTFLLSAANQIIPWFLQAGIIENLNHFDDAAPTFEFDEVKVLSLNDLEFGFVLWLAACALSLIIFLLEIVFKLLRLLC
jgi:hypothetical protein